VIATLVMEYKARTNGLIKGTSLQTVVAAPLEALKSARSNAAANEFRAGQLEFAKNHEDAPQRPVQSK
jgi:hypothetical protein